MNIADIARGALVEQVDVEIEKVIKNIIDPNTDIKKKRKITIVLEFKTDDEKRDISEVTFNVKSDLAPQKKVSTLIVFDKNNKGDIVVEELWKNSAKGQMWIDDKTELIEPKTASKVLNIK